MRILHLLYNSLPDVRGASIRSHQILRYQQQIGLDVYPISSPFQQSTDKNEFSEKIDGIIYFRSYVSGQYDFLNTKKQLSKRLNKILPFFVFLRSVFRLAKQSNVDLIHAHSTFFCGFTGLIISRLLHKPFVYEVRSDWVRGMIESGAFSEKSILAIVYTSLESFVIKNADHVVIIGNNLKDFVLRSGRRDLEKVTVIYNCVDLSEMSTIVHHTSRSATSSGSIVFGFIGTLYRYEGVDDLIKVFCLLKKTYENIKLVIVGGGECFFSLTEMAEKLGVEVNFVGEVPHHEIAKFYNYIDVIVLPRKRTKTTEQVTPLKPLEAMGFKKTVLASDVGGLKEIVNELNGLIFHADDCDDLYLKMEMLIRNPRLVNDLALKGYAWVVDNRNWNREIYKYQEVYRSLLAKKNKLYE